jgi:hypothetical protein
MSRYHVSAIANLHLIWHTMIQPQGRGKVDSEHAVLAKFSVDGDFCRMMWAGWANDLLDSVLVD